MNRSGSMLILTSVIFLIVYGTFLQELLTHRELDGTRLPNARIMADGFWSGFQNIIDDAHHDVYGNTYNYAFLRALTGADIYFDDEYVSEDAMYWKAGDPWL